MRWRLRFHVFSWLLVFLEVSIFFIKVFPKTIELVIYISIVIFVSKIVETVDFVFVDIVVVAVVEDFSLVLSRLVFFIIWNHGNV